MIEGIWDWWVWLGFWFQLYTLAVVAYVIFLGYALWHTFFPSDKTVVTPEKVESPTERPVPTNVWTTSGSVLTENERRAMIGLPPISAVDEAARYLKDKYTNPESAGRHLILYGDMKMERIKGYPCAYCGRPENGEATCQGCGAPVQQASLPLLTHRYH